MNVDFAPKPWDEFIEVISCSKLPLIAAKLWYDEARYSSFYNKTRPDLTTLLEYLLQPRPYVDIATNRMIFKPLMLEYSDDRTNIIFEFLANQKLNVSKMLLEKLLQTSETYDKESAFKVSCLDLLKENINNFINKKKVGEASSVEFTKKNTSGDKVLLKSKKRTHSNEISSASKKFKCENSFKNEVENSTALTDQILQQIDQKNYDKFIELLNPDLNTYSDNIEIPECFLVEIINKYINIDTESKSLQIFMSCFCVNHILKLKKTPNRILTNSLKQFSKKFPATFVINLILPLQRLLLNLSSVQLTFLGNLIKSLNIDQQLTAFCAFFNETFDDYGSKLDNILTLAMVLVNLKLKLSEKEIYFVMLFFSRIAFLLAKSFPFSKLVLCFVKNYKKSLTDKQKLKFKHDVIEKIETNLKTACLTLL